MIFIITLKMNKATAETQPSSAQTEAAAETTATSSTEAETEAETESEADEYILEVENGFDEDV